VDPRKLLRIARWEVTKNAGGLDRRTVLVAVGAIVLLIAVGPVVASGGVGLDEGLDLVGVAGDSPYAAVAANAATFATVAGAGATAPHRRETELLLGPGQIVPRDAPQGLAPL
jgi:ABC-type Na+ efflux pump permease subunit